MRTGAFAGRWVFMDCNWETEPIGQGKVKAKQFLEANPEIAEDIEAKIRARLFASDEDEEETDSVEASVGDLEEAIVSDDFVREVSYEMEDTDAISDEATTDDGKVGEPKL